MDFLKKVPAFAWFLFGLFLLLVIYISIVLGIYLSKFNGAYSNAPDVWGQFGDYLGGMLNPVVSLISFIVLAYIALTVATNEAKRERELLIAQGDLQYNVLLSNLRYHQYSDLLNKYILPLKESNYDDYTNKLKALEDKKDRILFLYEWKAMDPQFAALNDIKIEMDKAGASSEQKRAVYVAQKDNIIKLADEIKVSIQESILNPMEKPK